MQVLHLDSGKKCAEANGKSSRSSEGLGQATFFLPRQTGR